MPYIDFVSKDDRVSLWYTSNARMGGVGDFDPDKPVVLMYGSQFQLFFVEDANTDWKLKAASSLPGLELARTSI